MKKLRKIRYSGVEISYVNNNNEIINYCYFSKDGTVGIDTENRTETY
ncbi:hypothetical protein [Sedimentibacter sp.]|nr:hypothetical protein [Sedimentibacter sp.]